MKQGCCVWVIDKAIAGRFIQASAQVAQPELIETVLPAGVFFGTDKSVKTSQLGLTLVGPGQVNQLIYDHKDENTN